MSQYRTICRNATVNDCADAAWVMYTQDPFPSKHMDWVTYCQLVIDQINANPVLLVQDSSGMTVAWLTFDIDRDIHFPGKGAIVYHLLRDKDHPKALKLLMQEFYEILRANDCEWYQTTRRLNETTFESRFKRFIK